MILDCLSICEHSCNVKMFLLISMYFAMISSYQKDFYIILLVQKKTYLSLHRFSIVRSAAGSKTTRGSGGGSLRTAGFLGSQKVTKCNWIPGDWSLMGLRGV